MERFWLKFVSRPVLLVGSAAFFGLGNWLNRSLIKAKRNRLHCPACEGPQLTRLENEICWVERQIEKRYELLDEYNKRIDEYNKRIKENKEKKNKDKDKLIVNFKISGSSSKE